MLTGINPTHEMVPTMAVTAVGGSVAFKRSIVWVDAGGRTTETRPLTAAGAGAIMTQLEAVSNAAVVEWFEGSDTFPVNTPVNAAFPDVSDTTRLLFQSSGPGSISLILPAAAQSIFFADNVTVNPANIAALIAACIGSLSTPSGLLATSFIAGRRGSAG